MKYNYDYYIGMLTRQYKLKNISKGFQFNYKTKR